jgi:phosphoglycolate phosphatase-like HAD superfamily hydrolase
MDKISTVVFDIDGVLLDSLEPHLQICRDKNKEYGLGLKIPSADEFRQIVRKGTKISPMIYFFKAVGFPLEYAEKATLQYNEIFLRDYTPKPFPDVDNMLSKLAKAGLKLGIVTSNVRANVDAALGSCMHFFAKKAVLAKDEIEGGSKADALLFVAEKLNTDIKNVIYVGDQPADFIAAEEAGAKFLGVIYGWGISKGDKQLSTVDNVIGIADYILNKKD